MMRKKSRYWCLGLGVYYTGLKVNLIQVLSKLLAWGQISLKHFKLADFNLYFDTASPTRP